MQAAVQVPDNGKMRGGPCCSLTRLNSNMLRSQPLLNKLFGTLLTRAGVESWSEGQILPAIPAPICFAMLFIVVRRV